MTRADLAAVPWERVHRARSWTQATIHGVQWQGRRLAIKDFAEKGWLTRHIVGRLSLRREARAYERLRGLAGVPEVLGLIEGPALVMEWLPIMRLPRAEEGVLTPEFFDALDRLLDAIHARGVAHGDLRRKNIALGDDGLPRLIDFTTAACEPRGLGPFRRWLFRLQCRVDRITALRIRISFFPDVPLTPEQQALLASEPWLLKAGRWCRQRIYRPFKKRVLRR
jgi:serine/threonine protein kinase